MTLEEKDRRSNGNVGFEENSGVSKSLLELSERNILIICGMLIVSIFLFDISLEIGFVVSILYVIPVLVCIWSPKRRTIFLVAGASSILTLVAVPLKPSGDILLPLFNRPVSLIALWTVTLLVDKFLTERKKAEKVRRESQQDMNRAQSVSHTGSWRLDTRHDILRWSDESYRMFGIPTGTPLTYETFLDKVHPDDREYVDRKWQAAVHGEPYDIEHRIVVNGEVRWVRERAELELNKEGVLQGGFGTVQDITERKKAEEDLKQHAEALARSNAELQQFAYVASHDLQEPLRMVTAYLGLLEKKYTDQLDGTAKQYMDFAIEGGLRARDLISDLLEFSRVDTQGKLFQQISMEGVLNRTLDNLSVQIKEEKGSISHDHLPTILADELQMGQVMQNLISNAIKFHGAESPKVYIACTDQGQEWLFAVKDNGIGIDPKYNDKIFVLFQRLHNRDEFEGTGIGLAIAKKIVERHGGRIWFESQVGEGTTFYFTIPKGTRTWT